MNEGYLILAFALVAQGFYIMYLWSQLTRYRRTLTIATYALEQAYVHITEESDDEEGTTG